MILWRFTKQRRSQSRLDTSCAYMRLVTEQIGKLSTYSSPPFEPTPTEQTYAGESNTHSTSAPWTYPGLASLESSRQCREFIAPPTRRMCSRGLVQSVLKMALMSGRNL